MLSDQSTQKIINKRRLKKQKKPKQDDAQFFEELPLHQADKYTNVTMLQLMVD